MSFCSLPLIETYREGAVCPPYICLYSSVLSLLQKPVNVRVRSRTVSGNEFQIEGPEVAKLRDPYLTNWLRGIVVVVVVVGVIVVVVYLHDMIVTSLTWHDRECHIVTW